MADCIYNTEDIIDSRDVIARIEELKSYRVALVDDLNEAREALEEFEAEAGDPMFSKDGSTADELRERIDQAKEDLDDWDTSADAEELKTLKELAKQCEGYGDWDHGESLIADTYFKTYAEQLADDLGLLQHGASWPYTCIDWDQAADELKQDYTSVEFDGETYWMRA